MRRLLPVLVLALTGSLALVGPSASAMPVPVEPGGAAEAKPQVRCATGLTAVASDGRVRSQFFLNLRLRESRTTKARLKGSITGLGFYDRSERPRGDRLQLTATTSSGRPQLITLDRTAGSIRIGGVRKFAQRGFRPRVFTDGYSFYAYTIDDDKLVRWSLRRIREGRLRYAAPRLVGTGFADVTAMTPGGLGNLGGDPTEALYVTRADGSLDQLRVQLRRKPLLRVVSVASTGYAGVTGLAWSVCVKPKGAHSLIAVVPGEDRATLTTVERVAGNRPVATLVGDLEGVDDWDTLVATY